MIIAGARTVGNPIYVHAATAMDIGPGARILTVGFQNMFRCETFTFSSYPTASGDDVIADQELPFGYTKPSMVEATSLIDIGIIPDSTGRWSPYYISIADTATGRVRIVRWLFKRLTGPSIKAADQIMQLSPELFTKPYMLKAS